MGTRDTFHFFNHQTLSINDTELALQAELSRKSRDWDTMDWSDDNWEFDDEIRDRIKIILIPKNYIFVFL